MDIVTELPDLKVRRAPLDYVGGILANAARWKPAGDAISAWPHPMRRDDVDRAAGIAAALQWGEVYAWE